MLELTIKILASIDEKKEELVVAKRECTKAEKQHADVNTALKDLQQRFFGSITATGGSDEGEREKTLADKLMGTIIWAYTSLRL